MNRAGTQQSLSVAQAVERVRLEGFLLPGVQRTFVWQSSQIEALFDSIMRGYPIGTLVAWRTRPIDNPRLPFRKLVTDYKGKGRPLSPSQIPKRQRINALLDGQQRLTALNIGLRGSLATTESASPRFLFLNLDKNDEDSGPELNQYEFNFRRRAGNDGEAWFRVSDALGRDVSKDSLDQAMREADIHPSPERRAVLKALVAALVKPGLVRVDSEYGDLDRVLNLFARINKGGTPLTYADLLVSTATAHWKRDAQVAFNDLRLAMNKKSSEGFNFTTDRIVKAGLVVLNPSKLEFHVDSFMRGNKAKELDNNWPRFAQAMEVSAGLVGSFGLSARSMPAQNVIIPVAFYAYQRRLTVGFVTGQAYEKDRRRIRAFVARTLLRRAYWTGSVDPILETTCNAIKSHGSRSFPLTEIEKALAKQKQKPIAVTAEWLDELSTLPFSDRRTGVLLRLLYPFMVKDAFQAPRVDKDHVFPTAGFSVGRLRSLRVQRTEALELAKAAERLPNLQLLRESDNRWKKDKPPKDWLAKLDVSDRKLYTRQHVKNLPEGVLGAADFWKKRGELLAGDISRLVRGT